MLQWILKDGGVIPPMGNFWQCFKYLELKGRINPTKDEYTETINACFSIMIQEADKLQRENERRDYRKEFGKDTIGFQNLCREHYFKIWLQDQFMNYSDTDNSAVEWIEKELKTL